MKTEITIIDEKNFDFFFAQFPEESFRVEKATLSKKNPKMSIRLALHSNNKISKNHELNIKIPPHRLHKEKHTIKLQSDHAKKSTGKLKEPTTLPLIETTTKPISFQKYFEKILTDEHLIQFVK